MGVTAHHTLSTRMTSSTVPAIGIPNTLPTSLLSLIECARSLSFAVSQVYQALSRYTTHTVDTQLSSVLKKVMDPAYNYMIQLSEVLERLDATGKKGVLPSSLCRTLVETCRDTAAVFGKVMAMLSLQLKILASRDNDHYMRALVLTFYGAVVEVSHAWQSMVSHFEAIKPYLTDYRRLPVVKTHTGGGTTTLPNTDILSGSGSTSCTSFSVGVARSRPIQSNTLGRSHTTRRHAGSFSSKDVEIGKSLASYDMPPPSLWSITSSTIPRGGPSASASGTAPLLMTTACSSAPPASSFFSGQSTPNGVSSHSRQASQGSPSSSSSPLVPRRPTLGIPQSRTLVDEDALDAMERAVDTAPAVWEMMKDFLTCISEHAGHDLQDSLTQAHVITERLGTNLRATRCGDPLLNRKALREDAHMFVKMVVKLLNTMKAHDSAGALFSDLRMKMVSLINSTQEFVMLLHVSSFSPPTTRPHPSVSTITDNKLGPSLSRSFSARQPKSLKLVAPSVAELPRSALPNQTFNITLPVRPGNHSRGVVG